MRVILEIVCAVVVTNFISVQVAWRLGVKNGEKWERYRRRAKLTVTQVGERIQ